MIPGRVRVIWASMTLIGAMGLAGPPAGAAVRTCTARLTSIAAKDETELGAKRRAISDWLIKAAAAGIQAPTWRLAAGRRLVCRSVPASGAEAKPQFECVAVGHACAIMQNPKNPTPQPAALAGKRPETES